MNKIKSIVILLIIFINVSCQNNTSEKGLKNKKQEIESYLKTQIQLQEIPSLALAVIKSGEVIYEGYFGNTDLEQDIPIDKNTIYPIYSITKLMVSTGVFQLIEQNKISLEDNISKYIENTPEKWQAIKIKNLLTHSSGLPDISVFNAHISDKEEWARVTNENLHFALGNQYEYNQTNYWLLAQIIEKVSGISFEEYILNNQFLNIKSGVLFSSDFTKHIKNRVNRYVYNNATNTYINPIIYDAKRFHAANGLNITLRGLIEWNKRLDNNQLIKETTKQALWKPFNFKHKQDKFLHGWHTYSLKNSSSFGFTGGSHTGFRKFVKNDLTIIVLTNGHKYYSTHNDIINRVAGIIDENLIDKREIILQDILSTFLTKDINIAIENYHLVKTKNPETESKLTGGAWPNYEGILNRVGYVFLGSNEIKKALKIFELNVKEHSESANCYDSLAEAYLANNQFKFSKKNYEKSLKLDPENNNAQAMIKLIENRMKE